MFSEQKQKVLTFFILSKIAIIHHPSVVGSSSSSGVILHGGEGGGAGPGLSLGQSLLVDVSSLHSSGQVGLDLAVLGKVEGGDLLSLLDLLLVALDLALQLVDQTLHPLVVLPVLLLGVGQLLDLALRLAEVLQAVSVAPVFGVHLRLELPDASVHPGHGLLAALQGVGLGLVHSGLHVLDLGLQQPLLPLKGLGHLLLGSQLVSQAGGIDHGSLGLLLGQGGLAGHLVTVGLQGLHLGLQLHLGALDGLVGAGGVGQRLVGVGQLLLHHAAGAVSLLQQSPRLLQSVLVGVGLPLSVDQLVVSNLLGPLLVLQLGLGLPQVQLVGLDGPLGVGVGSVGSLQVALQVEDVSLQLLLHPESLSLGLGLSLHGGLHVLDGLGHVLLGGEELLVLLGHPPVDLLSDLGQLQLAPQHLVLLLLQGALGLGQGSLQLHLLGLQPLADFVNLVDGASSLADLVHDVLDLIGQGLVLPADLVQLEDRLLVGGLDAEQLGGGVAGLLLGVVKIHADAVNLLLPLTNNPVELLGLLLHGAVEDLGLVQLGGHGVQVSLELGLALLHLGQLGVQLVSGGLSLGEAGLHLQLSHLELLGLGHALLLVPQLHHLSLSVGLAHLPDHVLLGADFLVVVVLHASHIVLGVPVLAQQGLPLLGLVVGHGAGLSKLVGQGDLQLGEHVGGVLQLLQLAEQVGVLSSQLPLAGLHVSQGEVGLLNLLAQLIEVALEVPQALLSSSLAAVDLVSGGAGISNLVHDHGLVLLDLGLDLVELLDLLLHLGDGVLVLLLKTHDGGLLLDLGLLEVAAQLGHLGLSLLVQFNLSAGGTAGLIQTLAQALQLAGEVRPLPLGLGTALPLGLEFLLHLLNPGLDLLDGLLDLGHQGLLVLQLAQKARGILLLALDGVLQLLLGPLQLGHGLLHDLQLSLDLASLLLNVGTAALLLLVRALQLVKGGLELVLDLVEMADLVLSHLKVLLGLSSILADVLLLLVELVDDLILVGDLIIQALDGVVTVGLLLLQLLNGYIDVVNVLLDSHNLLLQDLLVLHGVLASLLPLGKLVLGGHKLLLVVSNLGGGLGLLLVVHGQVTLLLLQLGHQSLLLLLDGLILLQEPGLGVQLVLVDTIGGIGLLLKKPKLLLRVGHSNERTGLLDDDKPSPFSHGHVLPEVPLGNSDQLPLISLLLIDRS